MSNKFPWYRVYDEIGIKIPELDDRPLGSYVEEHATTIPNSTALQYFNRSITYAELNQEANKMARVLESLGVTKGHVVGLHMPNIPQYIIAMVAATKMGCAGSGISPLLSASEVSYQIENAGISVLICLDMLINSTINKLKTFPSCLQHVISVGASDYLDGSTIETPAIAGLHVHSYPLLMSEVNSNYAQQAVSYDDVMMVQYTGGTTGLPKGAELSVRTLMNNVVQACVYSPLQKGKEVIHTAFPLFHIAGMGMSIASLRFGGQFILIPDARDINIMCMQMKNYPPTILGSVPSLYQMLVDQPAFSEVDFSSLKLALSGAAAMSSHERDQLESIIGKGVLCDTLGMTETGPIHLCSPPGRQKPNSVGIPIPLAETRVVDLESGLNEMSFGEVGEIITTGPQVMRGYRNLLEESGIALRNWRGKTWMYTGDVGYSDEEGYIFLCDRAKDMLIVGGYKVFSVEVEGKLQSLPEIARSALIGEPNEDRPGNDVVTLYVELTSEAKTQSPGKITDKILEYCREEMAPYKVPKKIHLVDTIPLTAIGKIDKKALRRSP